jgi:DNA-binding NarL/FixJ family response regulator
LGRPVIIADSSELILKGLNTILKTEIEDDIHLCEDYSSLKLLLATNDNFFLIIDYTSKGFSLDQIVDLKNTYPKLIIMAITPYTNAQTIVQAVQAGVESHIKKECSIKEIKDAYSATISGKKFFCDDILKQMRSENVNVDKISFNSLNTNSATLSERELQIIQFIAEGYTNSQIAAIIYLSNHTVNTHRKNIMKKLNVNNTAGIVMYAVKTEMVSPSQFSFKKSTLDN